MLVVSEEPVVVNENNAHGGMRNYVNDTPWHTSGWSLEVYTWGASAPYFVTTAAHTPNNVNFIQDPRFGLNSYPFYSEYLGFWGDIQAHTTSAIILPAFYYSSDIYNARAVLSWEPFAGISIGESVCHFSRVQNSSDCAIVQDIWRACGEAGLTVMDKHITVSGDSGSGWFRGHKAFGAHQGYCGGRSSWMPVDFIDEALNRTLPPGFYVRLYLSGG